jgi:hypothetical protein
MGGEAATRLMGYARQGLANMGIDLGIGSPAPAPESPQNPTIFTLATDTVNLKPAGSDVLGGTSGGQGLLVCGAGYAGSTPSQYVNGNGTSNTAIGAMATNCFRPGNQSPADTDKIMNALRAQANAYRQSQQPQTGELMALPSSLMSVDHSAVVMLHATAYDGAGNEFKSAPYNVKVLYAADNTALGITALSNFTFEVRDANGVLLRNDSYLAGKSYAFDTSAAAQGGRVDFTGVGKVAEFTDGVVVIRNVANKDTYIDPLTLDAGNDGVRLSATPVNFGLNADGVAEALPWSAPSDPLLVMDVNGDGKINNGTELVDLTDSGKPLNLFRLDSNGDGVLNASDAAYWNLQLWQDRNQDGYASLEERQSLADTGIVSIDLNPAHLQTATVAGKANVKGVTATYTDGSTRTLWDVPLDSAAAATATSTSYAISINKVSGSGQTALVAMSALGVTLDLNGSGADQAIGGAGNDTLIGTGGDDWLIGGGGSNTYAGGAGSDLLVITADDQQANIDGGAGIDTVVVADDRGVMLNLAQAHVEVVYGGYGNDVFIGGGADNYFIDGAAGNNGMWRIAA